MNLLITGLFGLPILLGTIFVLFTKHSKKITELSISMAFGVLLLLIFLELIPETLEHLGYLSFLLFVVIGIVLLKLLDIFIPEHEHSNKKDHISHIGIMACVALILHNIIEGMALFTGLQSDLHLGIFIGIGVGLHNIPMGMIIGSTLKGTNHSNQKVIFYSLLVSISTLFGGLIAYFFKEYLTVTFLGIMLALTLGMLIYIEFFELFHHMKYQNKKTNLLGLVIGMAIFIISLFFHSH